MEEDYTSSDDDSSDESYEDHELTLEQIYQRIKAIALSKRILRHMDQWENTMSELGLLADDDLIYNFERNNEMRHFIRMQYFEPSHDFFNP